MYLLYLDESGVQELNAGTGHFVLLGVAVRFDQWKTLDANLERIKAACGLPDVEIHAGWMARRYSEQEAIPDFAQLTRDARRSAAEQVSKKRAGQLGVRGNRLRTRRAGEPRIAISLRAAEDPSLYQ